MPNRKQLSLLLSEVDAGLVTALLRQALLHDAGCAVAVVDRLGCVRECNDLFARLFAELSAEAMEGQVLADHLREAHATAHAQAIARAIGESKPTAVEGALGNRFVRATYRPMHAGPFDEPVALLVAAPLLPGMPLPPGVRLLRLQADPRDPLGSLTPREQEVLRFIGLGLPSAEIARQLNRSVKTVEGHRVSIGAKLGASNRVQLARIAIRAGLSPLSVGPGDTPPAADH